MRYTKGPWRVNPRAAVAVETADGRRGIASISRPVNSQEAEDEAQANARLIAAAPELAEALAFLLLLAQAFEKQASKGSGGRVGGPVFEMARAALAKAGKGSIHDMEAE